MSKKSAKAVVNQAKREGRKTLSEYESKQVLAAYGIPVTREILVESRKELAGAAAKVKYPLVMKGCSAEIAHKTEKNLIRVDIRTSKEALQAFNELSASLNGSGAVLVQEMVSGRRELVMGLVRDPQFGPCVMFGLGGIFTEVLRDITFRKAPLEKKDALDMLQDIKGHKILDAVRGMKAADRDKLAKMLIGLGSIGLEMDEVQEIDINPVILSGSKPVAVDALVVLK